MALLAAAGTGQMALLAAAGTGQMALLAAAGTGGVPPLTELLVKNTVVIAIGEQVRLIANLLINGTNFLVNH